MGVGSLLAGRRILLLDHLPVDPGVAAHQRPARRAQATVPGHAVVDLLLRRDVGLRRTDLRPDDALSGHVAGHGRGAGLLRRVRHACCRPSSRCSSRPFPSRRPSPRSPPPRPGKVTLARRARLPGRHRRRGAGRVDQGTGNARGGEEEGDRRVQLHQGHPGGHVLRHHERVLRVRAHRRQPDRRGLAGGRNDHALDRACPSSSWCCSAVSPPTSSGACS